MKKRYLYQNCKQCLERQKFIESHGTFDEYLKKFPLKTNTQEELDFAMEQYSEYFNDDISSRCPFKNKIPKSIIIKKYKLHCLSCGRELNCPAEVFRNPYNKPICEECYCDNLDDRYYPEMTEKDEQKEVDRYLVNRYGEC